MAAEIEDQYPGAVVRLVEGSGGAFEVSVNGELVYSKVETGRHARPGEVLERIRAMKGA